MEEATVFILEFFNSHWIERGPSCPCPEVSVVDGVSVIGLMVGYSVLGSKKQIVVVFIKVDDAQTVDPRIAGCFFDHCIDDVFPPGETVGVADSVVEEGVVEFPYFVSGSCQGERFVGVRRETIAFQLGMEVAEVAAGRGGACGFFPMSIGLFYRG
jgi:hypothetical protein